MVVTNTVVNVPLDTPLTTKPSFLQLSISDFMATLFFISFSIDFEDRLKEFNSIDLVEPSGETTVICELFSDQNSKTLIITVCGSFSYAFRLAIPINNIAIVANTINLTFFMLFIFS